MGPYTTCLCSFSPCKAQRLEVFETLFFDIVIPQTDYPRYLKHVLGRIYVSFSLTGNWVGGGSSQGIGTQPAYAAFHPGWLKNRSFRSLFP